MKEREKLEMENFLAELLEKHRSAPSLTAQPGPA
jgi:hypothetical protein